MSDGTRKRLGRNEARERILRAAARVYNEIGPGATVEDIAEEADYSPSALYKHFSNKDDIFETLWRDMKKELLAVLEGEPPVELSFLDRLKWLLFELAELADEKQEFFQASMANAPRPKPVAHMDESVTDIYWGFRETFEAIMQQGIDEGVLDDSRTAETYALSLGGQISALSDRWAMEGPFPMKPRMKRLLELFLSGATQPKADFNI
jgi:AcrR family transcriptional regulator